MLLEKFFGKFRKITYNLLDMENMKEYKGTEETMKWFRNVLSATDFEDGMDNMAIEWIRGFYAKDKKSCICFLYDLYLSTDNRSILAKIMRTIGVVVEKEYAGNFIGMVEFFIAYGDTEMQEAAIMAIEQWRFYRFIETLSMFFEENGPEATSFIKKYAEQVRDELIGEYIR